MNILLSYPRSGNHLVRFFIELLTELPTFGCINSKKDKCIFQNKFENKIPFNISKDKFINILHNLNHRNKCFLKYHNPSLIDINKHSQKLIVIIRNPKEVLLRHNNFKFKEESFNMYFDTIDFYLNYTNDKLLLYYEDIIENKIQFIQELNKFINEDIKKNKVKYVLDNIESLYFYSANPLKRYWGGINSNFKINYYYDKITDINFKKQFDNYLSIKLKNEKYNFIKVKYSL